MSLTGSADAGAKLRGKVNRLEALRGYSAYEVALMNGFKGTEEEWLKSLKGDPGKPPVKGTDYFTDEDKAEMVADVLAALPVWTGGGY